MDFSFKKESYEKKISDETVDTRYNMKLKSFTIHKTIFSVISKVDER